MAGPSRYGPYRRGDVRADGKIFFSYNHGREQWYEPEVFEKKQGVMKNYDFRATAEFQKKKHPPMWSFNSLTKLYYAGRSGAKERWVTEEEMKMIKKRRKRDDLKYKARRIPSTKYSIGQTHPDDPTLYFACYSAWKPIFLKYEEFLEYKKKRQETMRKCNAKRSVRKSIIMRKIEKRVARGTEKDGMIFSEYDNHGREKWVTPEEFKMQLEINREKTRRYRERKKNAINSTPGESQRAE